MDPRSAPHTSEALRLLPLLAIYLVVGAVVQFEPYPVRDEPALLAAAYRLLDGELAAGGTDPDQRAFLWHGPGIAALLAPLVALDVPLGVIRLIEPLLLAAATFLFHRLLRLRMPARPALLWTYAFGLYGPFYVVLGTIQKEPLAILLVVAAMVAAARGLATGSRGALVGAGLALTALAMVRLEYGWVLIALLAAAAARWAWRRDPAGRRLVLVAGVAVAGCVPWLAYTYTLTDQPMYWSASSGLSLFWMSPTALPGETGQWHSPVKVHREARFEPYRPLFRRLDEVHPLESDLELRRLALRNIREHPGRYVRNLATNTVRLFFWVPMDPPRPPLLVLVCVAFNGALLLGLGWSARRLWRRRRHAGLPPETVPFALFAALAVLIHIPPSASPRMLLPIVPVMLWLIAVAARPAAAS